MHSVSAWCHENGLILGEEKVCEKSNEVTAIPLLLESLALKDATVSVDAAGCQKDIAHLIRQKKGQYVWGLKLNQKKLYQAAVELVSTRGARAENRLEDSFEHAHERLVRGRYFGYGTVNKMIFVW